MVDAGIPVEEFIFLVALPVGAKSAISLIISDGPSNSFSTYNFTMAFIIVVLPVPGPPDIIVILLFKALFIAFS